MKKTLMVAVLIALVGGFGVRLAMGMGSTEETLVKMAKSFPTPTLTPTGTITPSVTPTPAGRQTLPSGAGANYNTFALTPVAMAPTPNELWEILNTGTKKVGVILNDAQLIQSGGSPLRVLVMRYTTPVAGGSPVTFASNGTNDSLDSAASCIARYFTASATPTTSGAVTLGFGAVISSAFASSDTAGISPVFGPFGNTGTSGSGASSGIVNFGLQTSYVKPLMINPGESISVRFLASGFAAAISIRYSSFHTIEY